MLIGKTKRSIGVLSVTVVFVKRTSKKQAMHPNGFKQAIVKKHAVNCVDSVPVISYKWMCITWMATEIMCPLII
jgi:hypothetical protein